MIRTSGVHVYEIDLTDPDLLRDPFTAYGHARETGPLARTQIPGLGPVWVLTRHADARAMLGDPRFELDTESFQRPDVPAHCVRYLRTMSEMNGDEHRRLRRMVTPAFTARHAAAFRPRVRRIVDDLLDTLPAGDPVDLLPHLARPLPMEVICELVGIPAADRPRWRSYGEAVATGHGPAFAAAIPGIMADAQAAVARRRAEPGDDLLADLVGAGDALTDDELVTFVWHLVLAGQTPTNLVANAVAELLTHPDQLAEWRREPSLAAVDELIRWCGPALLTVPRYATEDLDLHGVPIARGDAIMASVAAANRDPRAYPDPDRFDVRRPSGPPGHLGFGHGPHFCLGASLARVQTEVALTALWQRFPDLALAKDIAELRMLDPGTWRLTALPVTR
ncbi:MAG TPA: cytochrome P450 [Actinophytocola sp.]|nr:cytochrome P450 [Actinophytocola sp.]